MRLKKGFSSRIWENLILAMIGEQFLVGEEICGAVCSIRNQVSFALQVQERCIVPIFVRRDGKILTFATNWFCCIIMGCVYNKIAFVS